MSVVKKKYKILGMHCSSCAMNIEWGLEDAGFKAKCSYASQTLEVEFAGEKMDEKKIKEAVTAVGYTLADNSPD